MSLVGELKTFGRKAASYGLFIPMVAFADYQDGFNAYTYGDYATAMAEWQAVVAAPPDEVNPAIYAGAHYAIAKLYWLGAGVDQDYLQAHDWLLKAAELDHAAAQARRCIETIRDSLERLGAGLEHVYRTRTMVTDALTLASAVRAVRGHRLPRVRCSGGSGHCAAPDATVLRNRLELRCPSSSL